MGDSDDGPALAALEEDARRNPNNAEGHHRLARALHIDGQLQNAIAEYEHAIRLAPRNVELYLGLSDVFETANLMNEAETLLAETISAFPESVAARVELAEIRFSAGKVEKALGTFEEARRRAEGNGLATAGEHAFILRRIGDMHVHMIQFDEALIAYRDGLQQAPDDVDLHLALGKLYLRRNRLDDALTEYRIAVDGEPANATGHEGIAEASFRLGRFADAVAAADSALEIDPNRLRARYLRATALIRSGPDEAGRAALEEYRVFETESRATEQREREIGGIYKAALAEMLADNGTEAVRLLREGTAAHPEAWALHMNLGVTLSSLGRYAEAIEVFEAMIESGSGDSAAVRRSLADARRGLGDGGQ